MSGWLNGKEATVTDLFAGTAGMGLATLLSGRLRDRSRIIYTAELDADYVVTIRQNYSYFSSKIGSPDQVPRQIHPTNVASRSALDELARTAKRSGGLTLLLAGPPCQGFSVANRVTRERENPQNILALKTVEAIKASLPRIAVIENVPGIQSMESARRSGVTVSEHIEDLLGNLGYRVQTHLLDAANYGVPQHRLRSFTIAIHERIAHNFDFENLVPQPLFGPNRRFAYRTVGEAFGDLPRVQNGSSESVLSYARAASTSLQRELRRYSKALFDHVTTRHAEYVIERYTKIPRGGNWRAIRDDLANYSDPDSTHTNIYHRLHPGQPSRTIGNFRKAMTIHPYQDRGLSIREAARLQSIPDWIRFFEPNSPKRCGVLVGMGKRQQQVGNAVCFRLTSELVSHLFKDA